MSAPPTRSSPRKRDEHTPGERRLRAARAYLSRVAEPPAPALADLVDEAGPERAARLVADGLVPEAVARETAGRRDEDRAGADLAALAALGGRLVVPEDDEWPAAALAGLAARPVHGRERLCAPLALWVRGPARLDELGERSAAVVGSRAATGYGAHVAGELGYGLAERGVAVVSGAAHGIDGAAHRGALAAEGLTAAVLACGPDRVYPAGHTGLLRTIGETGVVVSEYPPGSRPAKHRFLVRNRLIAALSAGTVVVEAGLRSGARSTAALAELLGRPVMAVPGPVTSATSEGCHRLVREAGAVLVTRPEEVVEVVGRIGDDLAPERTAAARATDGLSRTELAVHEALPARAARHAERLAREAGVPLAEVRAALPLLELRGLVALHPDGWRRQAAVRQG